MKAKLLKRVNIILASLITMLGVGCKVHKTVPTTPTDDSQTMPKEEVIEQKEIRCLYGPAPMMYDSIKTEPVEVQPQKPIKKEEVIMVKYGVPPQFR